MRKVIWVINQTAGKPDSGWGERHYFLSKYWVKKGYEVVIISGSYNHLFINQPNIAKQTFTLEKIEEGITFCWVKIPVYNAASVFKLWSMIVFAFKVLFLTKKIISKPDVIIVSSMPIFPIVSGWFLKKRYKAQKLFFEIRDLWPLTPLYLKGYKSYHPMIILMKWLETFGYRKADYIVSLLPKAGQYINPISGNPNKFVWIPNGIDQELLDKEQLSKEIIYNIPKDKFIIGYAGTIGLANALEYFIGASVILKEDSSVYFVCVGDGYLKSELQEITKGNSNITFLPKIKKSQVQLILEQFDVCFIGRNDTRLFDYGVSSNKYFDYMLAKKPVLVSSKYINDPVQLSGCGITVKPECANAIVEGIKSFQSMTVEQRNYMGKKGYYYVLKNHNFRILSEQYEQLF
ncbi:MAG: glycosyltransferase family 4 protein [Flavobacteriaceae bacterium]|nr:glycosyltransferase family 4 protein [Flavobacteriaceae bacterium]